MISSRFRALTANSTLIRTAEIISAAKAAQTTWARDAERKLKQYPPPVPTSDYSRTGDLGRGWRVSGPSVQASAITTRITNSMDYAVYVYGDENGVHQQPVFAGRWPLFIDVLDHEGYIAALRKAISDAVVVS